MRAQGIYLNVSRRNDDLPQLIKEYSEQFNLSKADTFAEILRAYPKLLAYKHRVMEQESRSFGRCFLNALSNKKTTNIHPSNFNPSDAAKIPLNERETD